MLTLCWRTLTLSCPMLTLCWPKLPLSCPYVKPMFTYVGLGNALPHSSDRNGGGGNGVGTGWGGGREGVGRGWGGPGRRLGRRASITFGYQAKASGKDTGCGCWPAPGFNYFGPSSPLCWLMSPLGLCMLALGWVYLCCHAGLSTLYWPHLPLTLAYPILAPSLPDVGLCWPYVCQPYIGPISPLCWPTLALW